jgi:hypothetical protein
MCDFDFGDESGEVGKLSDGELSILTLILIPKANCPDKNLKISILTLNFPKPNCPDRTLQLIL